jgi:alcohol dehydrogenase
MKAAVVREHGGPDRLNFEADFPDPRPGEGDVIVAVKAASLNYHDVFTRRGMPGIKVPMPAIMGLDVAGEIAEVGKGAGWAGDRVLVDPINRVEGGLMGETIHGGLAELCRARAHQLIKIPEGVSFADAAALPVAYGTAIRMMRTNGHVAAGEKVLILGASGGVGVCCLQLAKLAGAEVVACAGTDAKAERLAKLGADKTINYVKHDFMDEVYKLYGKPTRRGGGTDRGVDVVVNYTGGDTWVKSLKVLKVGGRMLTCGATAGFAPQEDIRFIWTFELKVLGSNGWARSDIITLLEMVQRASSRC